MNMVQWLRRRRNPAVLTPERSIILPPLERFVAAERFRVGEIVGCRPIGYLGEKFLRQFSGVVETHLPRTTLRTHCVTRYVRDGEIIDALGDRRVAQNLARVIQLMEVPEVCRENGRENVLYFGTPGTKPSWVVHWKAAPDNSWCVAAFPVTYPIGWDIGDCIVSGEGPSLTLQEIH